MVLYFSNQYSLIFKYICICRHDPNRATIGSPYYSAPECFQWGAHVTSKADIWSAGAILYHMTYGQPPLQNSAYPPTDSYPTHSNNVEDILHHCLQEHPHRRGSHHWLAHHPYTANPMAF
jgi:serine/threonine protein kinase